MNIDGCPVRRGGSGSGGDTGLAPNRIYYCGRRMNQCRCGMIDFLLSNVSFFYSNWNIFKIKFRLLYFFKQGVAMEDVGRQMVARAMRAKIIYLETNYNPILPCFCLLPLWGTAMDILFGKEDKLAALEVTRVYHQALYITVVGRWINVDVVIYDTI